LTNLGEAKGALGSSRRGDYVMVRQRRLPEIGKRKWRVGRSERGRICQSEKKGDYRLWFFRQEKIVKGWQKANVIGGRFRSHVEKERFSRDSWGFFE